jgi:hypothetical protein
MRPLSPSLVTSGLPLERGTSARSELVPLRALTRMRVHSRPLRVLLAVIDAKTLHESRCERGHAEAGRRFVPSATERARMVEGNRGVNDPGAAWPVRPQALVYGGRSRPAVSMSDEAREQPPSSGGSSRNRQARFRSRSLWSAWTSDGHHVREHARSARRRARFSGALRPRAPHAARACPSWVLDDRCLR